MPQLLATKSKKIVSFDETVFCYDFDVDFDRPILQLFVITLCAVNHSTKKMQTVPET